MVKRQSDFTAVEWARLYPEQRFAIQQADTDAAINRNAIPVLAADGRSTVYLDPVTRAPIPQVPGRRIGGLA